MIRAYIAGPLNSPIEGVTPTELRERFWQVREWLLTERPTWQVLSPLDQPPLCETEISPGQAMPRCQDLSGHPSDSGHSWECWMRGDLRAMLTCDQIVLLPDWDKSNGALLENHIAERLFMPRWEAHRLSIGWVLRPA